MKLTKIASVAIALVSLATMLMPHVAAADDTWVLSGFCENIAGTFTWDANFHVTLDIPESFDASQGCFYRTFMERNCGAFISGPDCQRRKVDGLFGRLEGTVGRLGRCDPRPPEPGHLAGTIYGLHLTGPVRAIYSPQRRVYGPPLTLDLDQMVLFPIYEPPFPGPAPVSGSMSINGKPGSFLDPLLPHWAMKTRVFSNCPPGGDPKAKVHLNFFLSGAFG